MKIYKIILILLSLIIIIHLVKPSLIEGASNQYEDYDNDNISITVFKNAANISWLKDQLGDLDAMRQNIIDISNANATNASNIEDIQAAVDQYGQNVTGSSGDPNEQIPQVDLD